MNTNNQESKNLLKEWWNYSLTPHNTMTNEEKIKEILEKIKKYYVIIDSEGAGDTGAEQALQEYGEWVRQQTLEEGERCLPEAKEQALCLPSLYRGLWKGVYDFDASRLTFKEGYKDGFNDCRQQTLSNLQALKDKNK